MCRAHRSTGAQTPRIDEAKQSSSIFSALSYLLAGSDGMRDDLSRESAEADKLARECVRACKIDDLFSASSQLPEPALQHLFRLVSKFAEEYAPATSETAVAAKSTKTAASVTGSVATSVTVTRSPSPVNRGSTTATTTTKVDENSAIYWLEMTAWLTAANQQRSPWCWYNLYI